MVAARDSTVRARSQFSALRAASSITSRVSRKPENSDGLGRGASRNSVSPARNVRSSPARLLGAIDAGDPNGRDDIATNNELILPLNRQVVIEVGSKDVIHNLHLVPMRIAQDAIPGVHVDVANNGKVAVELATANSYDLILMDVQMPEMNGYDATRTIRALPGGKSRTPIIAMTANVMKAEVERCTEAGMNGFVPKPFKREELMNAIRSVLAG